MTHKERVTKDIVESQAVKDVIRRIAGEYADRNQKHTAGLLDAACVCIEWAQVEML